jgi:zinc protease
MNFSFKIPSIFIISLILCLFVGYSTITGDRSNALEANEAAPVSANALTQGVRESRLNNGLTVLTKEIHTAPVASVQVWYRVGTRNEPEGQNGISHQLEHLLFKGTKDRPVQFGRLFSALGSQFNAFTSYDETAYFGTVKRDKLDALLTLEADRMINSINGSEQLTSEKRVVISELQGYENFPDFRLSKKLMKAVFPDRNYGLPVGGTKADVEKFTVEQVGEYYQKYYTPENATLVVTGDFDTEAVLKAVKETFGKIPQKTDREGLEAKKVPAQAPSATPNNQTPIVLKEPGSAALLEAVYPLPNINHPDVSAIDVMDVVLTGGRSSRLYQALIESGLASDVSSSPAELIEPGWYDISVTAAPGRDPKQIEKVLAASLAKLRNEAIAPEELNRAKTLLQTNFVLSNQDITSQASQLGYYQTVSGDYRFVERYLDAIAKVTAADVQRAAKTYLAPEKQTIGFFEPTQSDGTDATINTSRTSENFNPGKPVDPDELAKYLPPANSTSDTQPQPLPEQITLANGMKVFLMSDRSVPTINLSGYVDAGTGFDTAPKAGTASLTAANLTNGTQTQDALTLARTLEDRGIGLGFEAEREGVNIIGNSLSTNLPTLLETLADVLQNATFPDDQLQLSRQRALTSLKIELDDPATLGRRLFQQAIYPSNHPFHNFPSPESLQSITRNDLVAFYEKHYRPDTTVLALVGDFETEQVKTLLNRTFGQWQTNGKPSVLQTPSVSLPKATQRLSEVIPGKAEAVTYIGYNGISRKDPRFYSALVLNQILGGDTLSSRLGTEVRDRQGLTYGIYSAFAAGRNPGPFLIQMQTSPEDAQQAIASTMGLLKQLREEGISEAELETAKRSITNSYPVDLANPSSVSDTVLRNAIDGLSEDELRDFPNRIEAVSMSEIKQAIAQLIHPDNLVIVTTGPQEVQSSKFKVQNFNNVPSS